MQVLIISQLHIKETEKRGRGVFATATIEKGTLLETSPVIVLNHEDTEKIHETYLHDYYFSWGKYQMKSAIALGYVSIYNHMINPNCYYECNYEAETISVYSRRKIEKNEELCINYNLDPMSKKKLWFEIE
ncbi:MAG: SET domain-containing protein [Chitinophagales bacterium]